MQTQASGHVDSGASVVPETSPIAASNNQRQHLDRRTFVKVGLGGVVVLGGATGLRAYDQGVFAAGEGPAFDPWRMWPPYIQRDGLPALIGAAILAANPHNTQAWRFTVAPNRIEILSDLSRAGGPLDPFFREHIMGLGCAVENLDLAASANGYGTSVSFAMDRADQGGTIALDLTPAVPLVSELYDAIPHRHTNRGPYHADQPDASTFSAMADLVGDLTEIGIQWFTSDDERAEFSALVIDANDTIDHDNEQSDETRAWFRTSWDAVQNHRDGLTIDTGGVSPLTRVFGKMIPGRFVPLNVPKGPIQGTPVFGLITANNRNDRTQQLNGGRAWQRLHLWATTRGLAMQPVDSPLVRADRERELGIDPEFGDRIAALVENERQPLLPFRLGYPERGAGLAPRRSIESVIVES